MVARTRHKPFRQNLFDFTFLLCDWWRSAISPGRWLAVPRRQPSYIRDGGWEKIEILWIRVLSSGPRGVILAATPNICREAPIPAYPSSLRRDHSHFHDHAGCGRPVTAYLSNPEARDGRTDPGDHRQVPSGRADLGPVRLLAEGGGHWRPRLQPHRAPARQETIAPEIPCHFRAGFDGDFHRRPRGHTMGTVAAVRANSSVDQTTRVVSLVAVSMPVFWLGLLLLMVFYNQLGWLPGPGRYTASGFDDQRPDTLHEHPADRHDAQRGLEFLRGRGEAPDPSIRNPRVRIDRSHSQDDAVEHARGAGCGVCQDREVQGAAREGRDQEACEEERPDSHYDGRRPRLRRASRRGCAHRDGVQLAWPGTVVRAAAVNLDTAGIMGFTLLTAIIYVMANLAG